LVSSVVRTYGWIVILGEHGWVNFVLQTLGLSSSPLRLTNNFTGVVIALTEILMPYMALSLISGFGRLEIRYEEAALTLGASPWNTFWRVTFPLCLPGVALGSLICFALTISSFVTPQLLGGGRVFLLSTEIYDGALVTLNWPRAAALSMLLLALLISAVLVFNRYMKYLEEQ
jgi:putative spermidine/putrescine transport system permease protein